MLLFFYQTGSLLCFQSKKRFNDCLSLNAKLRDEIESHRNEHRRFENLYKKLEKELKNLRREMAEIIESSTAAYDQRLHIVNFNVL